MNKIAGDVLNGDAVKSVRTLKSMYDNDCIEVEIGRKAYRMSVDTIWEMINYFYFDTEKKTKHTYLISPQCVYDEHGEVPKDCI